MSGVCVRQGKAHLCCARALGCTMRDSVNRPTDACGLTTTCSRRNIGTVSSSAFCSRFGVVAGKQSDSYVHWFQQADHSIQPPTPACLAAAFDTSGRCCHARRQLKSREPLVPHRGLVIGMAVRCIGWRLRCGQYSREREPTRCRSPSTQASLARSPSRYSLDACGGFEGTDCGHVTV